MKTTTRRHPGGSARDYAGSNGGMRSCCARCRGSATSAARISPGHRSRQDDRLKMLALCAGHHALLFSCFQERWPR
jgi:hypothetical protein